MALSMANLVNAQLKITDEVFRFMSDKIFEQNLIKVKTIYSS